MSAQKHRIKRVSFEFGVAQESQARDLHAGLGHVHATRILPLLDRCLGAVAGEHELIQLDRVEVDLGALQADDLETALVEALGSRLPNVLKRDVAGRRRRQDRDGKGLRRQSDFDLLELFARTGVLPWWADANEPRLLDRVIDGIANAPPAVLRARLGPVLRTPDALARLLNVLSAESLSRLAAVLTGLDGRAVDGVARTLMRRVEDGETMAVGPDRKAAAPRKGPAASRAVWGAVVAVALRSPVGAPDRDRLLEDAALQVDGRAMSGDIAGSGAGDEPEQEITARPLDIFVAFAESGVLPRIPDKRDWEAVVDDLIERAAADLRRRLPSVLRRPRSAARIVRNLYDGRLSRLVALLTGLEPDIVRQATDAAFDVLAGTAPELDTGARARAREAAAPDTRRVAWELALAAAAESAGREWGSDAFSVEVARRASALAKTRTDQPVGRRDSAQRDGVPAPAPLPKPRELLTEQGSDAPSVRSDGGDRLPPEVPRDRAAVSSGPAHGWPAVLRLLKQPVALLRSDDVDRLAETIEALVAAAVAPPAEVYRRLPPWRGALGERLAPGTMESLFRSLKDRPEPTPRPRRSEDRVSDVAEAYVDNAGLVILWPFLERFFRRLDLLDEAQFRGSAAATRAVALLQNMASEDPAAPEYLLAPNKVLCGMSPSDLYAFDDPLSDTETEECTQLLEAAIGHAPVLRNMSVEGFRGSFLLRKGVLSTEDGSWLLRVEAETYDVVLERFPWSFAWVRLPWMPSPLRVEW